MIKIWIARNKDNSASSHVVEPTRNHNIGKWVSKRPFASVTVQQYINKIVSNSALTWDDDPEYIELGYSDNFEE